MRCGPHCCVIVGVVMAVACGLDRSGAYLEPAAPPGVGGSAVATTVSAPASATSTGGAGGRAATGGAGGAGGGATVLDCSSSDLLACYRFDGDALDGSANQHHLGEQGTVAFVPGAAGQAVRIAGDTVLMTPPASSWVSSQVSIDMWIYAQSLPAVRGALFDNGCCYSVFLYANGGVRCRVSEQDAYVGPVTPGVWTHVACVYDGSSVRAYLDGVLGDTVAAGTLAAVSTDTAVGINVPRLDDRFDGDIDSLRVWSVPLSLEQICAAAGC